MTSKLPDSTARPSLCAAPGSVPLCAHCGQPATCIGHYEDPLAKDEYACDDCCGHGNEDGHCRMLVPGSALPFND